MAEGCSRSTRGVERDTYSESERMGLVRVVLDECKFELLLPNCIDFRFTTAMYRQ